MNEEPPLNRGISWAIDKNFSDEENNLADSDYQKRNQIYHLLLTSIYI